MAQQLPTEIVGVRALDGPLADSASSVLLGPALLSQCLQHLSSAADFTSASRVCMAWQACLVPANKPLWEGFLQKHLTNLSVWERINRRPGQWWMLQKDNTE